MAVTANAVNVARFDLSQVYLRRALALREYTRATLRFQRITYHDYFCTVAATLPDLSFVKVVSHSDSWYLPKKSCIILSGDEDRHYFEGIRLIGEHIWYTMPSITAHSRRREAKEMSNAFRVMLLCGMNCA